MAKSTSLKPALPVPQIAPYGDAAIFVQYPSDGYDAQVSEIVLTLAAALRSSGKWEDVASGYDSLVASFNPAKTSLRAAVERIQRALKSKVKRKAVYTPKVVDVPVWYGGESGPDMQAIMNSSGLSAAEIISLHSAEPYRVCMMGFVPGFTFLSEAPAALHHPRHKDPRLSVPAGSVGIAGWQTGIYGLTSPGGWQVIGRTPLTLFDASKDSPFLWQAGDSLRFVPQSGAFPDESPREDAP